MNTTKHAADHASQANTLPVATAHRELWDNEDLEFVATFNDERDEDLALALGRTLYAIRGIRSTLDIRRDRAALRRALKPRELTITSYDEWEASFAN